MTRTPEASTITRREFLAMTAGTAAAIAIGAAWAQNNVELDPAAVTNTDHATDVLVIGGGMAGLFAAVKAHDAGARTMIVSKGRLGSSGMTPFAKGFFIYDPKTEELSVDEFVATVSRSALGTSNPVYTRQLAEHSLDRARELRQWGFFDQTLANRPFMKPMARPPCLGAASWPADAPLTVPGREPPFNIGRHRRPASDATPGRRPVVPPAVPLDPIR